MEKERKKKEKELELWSAAIPILAHSHDLSKDLGHQVFHEEDLPSLLTYWS